MIRQQRGTFGVPRRAPETASAQKSDRCVLPRRSLAMASVPDQAFENLYEPDQALKKGTLFADLDMPFHGGFRV